jgi:hypothetical protein
VTRADWVVEVVAISAAAVGFGRLLWDRAHYVPPEFGDFAQTNAPAADDLPKITAEGVRAAMDRLRKEFPDLKPTEPVAVRYKRITTFPYVVAEIGPRRESLTEPSQNV